MFGIISFPGNPSMISWNLKLCFETLSPFSLLTATLPIIIIKSNFIIYSDYCYCLPTVK